MTLKRKNTKSNESILRCGSNPIFFTKVAGKIDNVHVGYWLPSYLCPLNITLKRKNNHSNVINELKLVENELLQLILDL